MRIGRVIAAVSIGAAVIVVGPLADPASAAVTATTSGTAVTVTATGDASVQFDCGTGKVGFSGAKMNVLYITGGLGAEAGGGGLFRIELPGAEGLVILPKKK